MALLALPTKANVPVYLRPLSFCPSRTREIGKGANRSIRLFASSSPPLSVLSSRLDGLDKPTVWHELTPLSIEHGSVNLGQGFPDWDPPEFCIEAMERATNPKYGRNANQYARPNAHLALAKVLAQEYSERWEASLEGDIDPLTQIATASGCTNVLYCALQALLDPGDEVLLLEPAFDIYSSQVTMAGGVSVYCPLRPIPADGETTGGVTNDDNDSTATASRAFQLDLDELESKITSRTKILLLNTPHNPTGKMFSKEELTGIANIVLKYPKLIVISDEVYEHIIFEKETEPHLSIATIPGMFDRTLTLSSSGKTFSCTGWKVGWSVGPPHLVHAVVAAQQWVNFSAVTPTQDAIAQSLEQAKLPYRGYDTYYDYLAEDYRSKRQILMEALSGAGMKPLLPPGSFFIMADTSSIPDEWFYDEMASKPTRAMPASPMPRDWALARWLTQEVGVTAIPPSAFYSSPNVPLAKNLLRFAFCKNEDTLREGQRRLESYFSSRT